MNISLVALRLVARKPKAGTGSSIDSSLPSSLVCRVRRIVLCSQGGMSFLGHIFFWFLYLFIHTEINPYL